MKKLSLSKINLQPDELMEKSQMAKIHGGAGWMCFCGIGGCHAGGGTYFEGDGEAAGRSALMYMASTCGGSAECFAV